MTAATEQVPPTASPASAPTSVSRRHQMPSTSSGQNVDAATANTRPTERAMLTPGAASASPRGTTTAITAETRNAVIGRSRRLTTSWLTTPATAIVSPDEVDRNAANAPAVVSADSSSPPSPPIIRAGSSSTTVSARPLAIRSGAYSRPRAPYTGGST